MKKLPDNAKKVFEGVLFDVYQWEQEMYDGSTAIFERLDRPDATQCIAIMDGKIALVYDEQPTRPAGYTLPGGRVERGEEIDEAARRELLEETGFEAKQWELLLTVSPAVKIDWTIYTYIARDCKKVADTKFDPGERIELKLVDFEEFIDIVLREDFLAKNFQTHIWKMKGDYTEFRKLLGV